MLINLYSEDYFNQLNYLIKKLYPILIIVVIQNLTVKTMEGSLKPGVKYANQILHHLNKDTKQETYFLPARVRLKFKMFKEIQIQEMSSSMEATLIISILHKGLPSFMIKALAQKLIVNVPFDSPLEINNKVQIEDRDDELHFYFRGTFKLLIYCNIFRYPFSTLNMFFTVDLLKVIVYSQMDENSKQVPSYKPKYTLRFNLMNCDSNSTKISYTELGKFGNIDLAEKLMSAQYSNSSIPSQVGTQMKRVRAEWNTNENDNQNTINANKSKRNKSLPKEFEYAHFKLPVYNYPLPALTTILFPLCILSIINLSIFFQNWKFSQKVAILATVMTAFAALIPTIRLQIPPSDQITLLEVIVSVQIFTSILCLLHSWLVDKHKNRYHFQKHFLFALYWICLLAISLIVTYFYVHYRYSIKHSTKDCNKCEKLGRDSWYNQKCSILFSKYKDIKPIQMKPIQNIEPVQNIH